jgi:predicted dehydrogenase
MAMSLAHALRMVRACQQAGTTMLVNWPMTWEAAAHKAKALIDEGVVGRVLQVKWRGGHTGPLGPGAAHAGVSQEAAPLGPAELAATWWHHESTGGGAFLDYCCYGCMVSRWYVGQSAIAAVGMRGNLNSQWADADDNGAMIVRFPGAIGLFEASWTTYDHGVPCGPIVYGQMGTLVVETRDSKRVVRLERGHGQTTIYTASPLPEGRDQVSKEFIHHLETKEPVHPTLEMMLNLEVMATLDAGVRSTCSGKLETVDSAAWRIG